MAMDNTSVKIKLDLDFGIKNTLPDILVKFNQEILLQGPQQKSCTVLIDRCVPVGTHRLSVEFLNKNYNEPMDMYVLINQLRFQHLDNNFNIYSQYQPDYPKQWAEEQQQQGQTLKPVIHANHLGWNGVWWVDFETPIYRWIHQRLNLGWLVK